MNITDQTRELVRSLNPIGDKEARDQQLVLDLLAHSEQPFSKHHYEPGHLTASAYVISSDQQSVLLIFHESLKRWLQPGGHFDATDVSAEAAARREVMEEVGLSNLTLHPRCQGLFDIDVHEIPEKYPYPKHMHFDLRFLFQTDSKLVQAGSDALKAQWFSITTLVDHTDWASTDRITTKLTRLWR